VIRLPLLRDDNYCVDLDELEKLSATITNLIALVNPNSPTGQHIPCEEMENYSGNSDNHAHLD